MEPESRRDTEADTAPSPKTLAIQAYAAAGLPLIPLNGKIPTIRDWVSTPPGKYGVKELAGINYGAVLIDGWLVVDIDPRNFAQGDHPIARLSAAIGGLESFTVKTGGGGFHVYYRIPLGFRCVNSLPEYPGIEFKALGRQVAAPGSIHPTTHQPYVIIKGEGPGGDAQNAPSKLLELIAKPAQVAGDNWEKNEEVTYRDDVNTQGRYAEYLQDVAPGSVQGQGGNHNAFRVAAHGRDLGLPPASTLDLLLEFWNKKCNPPWSHGELSQIVAHAYAYAKGQVGGAHPANQFTAIEEDPLAPEGTGPNEKQKEKESEEAAWITNGNGNITKCFQNLLTYLRLPAAGLRGVFGYNEFTAQVEFTNPAPWHKGIMPRWKGLSDDDLKLLKGHLAVRHGYEAVVQTIEEAIVITAKAQSFHPVREYLQSLTWDGVPRLDSWLIEYGGAEDTPYTRAVARKTLVAAVQRVFKPGCKFDHVLVLEGEQGIGKSGMCKILGGEWASDAPVSPHDKDTIQLMQGKWIVEIAELETTRKADDDALKAFLTRSTDQARLAYGRLAQHFPRQSVFIGTINPTDAGYLKDTTGNRRWWPVLLSPPKGRVDFAAFKAVRNQLWAEAVAAAKKGESIFMETAELTKAAREAVGTREIVDPWSESVQLWLDAQDVERDFFSGREIYMGAIGGNDLQFDRRVGMRLAVVMRRLGWTSGYKSLGKTVRGYRRHKPERPGAAEVDVLAGMM